MKKYVLGFTTAALIIFVGLVFSQLQIAFGWNNPAQNPPAGSGALSAGPNPPGNVGLNFTTPTTAKLVINGGGLPAVDTDPTGAAAGKIIGLTANPLAPDEAASKAYVDAQVSGAGGGGKPVVTVYGVSGSPLSWAEYASAIGKTISTCLLGTGKNCNLGVVTAQAGAGATCPSIASGASSNWVSIYAGYGPYAFMEQQYWYRTNYVNGAPLKSDVIEPPEPDQIVRYSLGTANSIAATYSVCGNSPFLVAQTDFTLHVDDTNSIGAISGVLTACVPQAGGVTVCNTCRICQEP